MILETISSDHKINVEKFEKYTLNTCKLYVDLYSDTNIPCMKFYCRIFLKYSSYLIGMFNRKKRLKFVINIFDRIRKMIQKNLADERIIWAELINYFQH